MEGQRGRRRGALSLQSFVNYVFACSANVAFPPLAQRMAKTKAVSLSQPRGKEERERESGVAARTDFRRASAGQSRTRLAGSLR